MWPRIVLSAACGWRGRFLSFVRLHVRCRAFMPESRARCKRPRRETGTRRRGNGRANGARRAYGFNAT